MTAAHDSFLTVTGNPFVDAGTAAICVISKREAPEDLTKDDLSTSIRYLTKLYKREEWQKNIHGKLFLNAEIGNPSYNPKERPKLYELALMNLLQLITPLAGTGSCVACGSRDGFPVARNRVPLLGSFQMVNFFASGRMGELFCPACTLAIQFLPQSVQLVGGQVLLLSSPLWDVAKSYVEIIMQQVQAQESKKEGGIVTFGYSKGPNAIFYTLSQIVTNPNIMLPRDNCPPLTFYHLTNSGQGPKVDRYDLPSVVFDFRIEIEHGGWKSYWDKLVKRGYIKSKKDEDETIKTVQNRIFLRLLSGQSIAAYFIDRDNQLVIGNWDFFSYYLTRVRM
ncbi:MAG: type I-B CRISPR-associated protein Cas8b1/Cst1, partial [Candidatus Thorarchaeota archaeon]|nr:type I-B CRISPR-associated protein Cas8b1/Cst1 [Candidatus Thorarchaeota archaeon]